MGIIMPSGYVGFHLPLNVREADTGSVAIKDCCSGVIS